MSAGIADTEQIKIPKAELSNLNYDVDELYEDEINNTINSENIPITSIKGIGRGTAENLEHQGIKTVDDLLKVNSKTLATTLNGISENMINKWIFFFKKFLVSFYFY